MIEAIFVGLLFVEMCADIRMELSPLVSHRITRASLGRSAAGAFAHSIWLIRLSATI